MKFFLFLLPLAATVLTAAAKQKPAQDPVLGTDTIHGCYSSVGELKRNGTNQFNGQGVCGMTCRALGAKVAASQGTSCYCGQTYPAVSTLVDDSDCDEPCPGFSSDACGGKKAFTVYNTGLAVNVENAPGSSTTSTSPSTLPSPTGTASNGTTSTTSSSPTGATGTPSTTPLPASRAVSQYTIGIFNMAVLGFVAVLFT